MSRTGGGACPLTVNLTVPRQTMHEFVEHYHRERNHQGIGNELITGPAARPASGRIRRRPRLGGLLNYYERAA